MDDYPYGGGAGMVMRPEPLFAAIEPLRDEGAEIALLDPAGERLTDALARELAASRSCSSADRTGIDERVRTLVDREISIGDYVLTGESCLPSSSSTRSCACFPARSRRRRMPGTRSRPAFSSTRSTASERFRDLDVPPILLGGNHGEVDRWRRRDIAAADLERRPDLLESRPR